MLRVLANPTYTRLFAAQVISLLVTRLMTIALGLLAFDLAGAVLCTALAVALPRKALLIGADLIRAAVALAQSAALRRDGPCAPRMPTMARPAPIAGRSRKQVAASRAIVSGSCTDWVLPPQFRPIDRPRAHPAKLGSGRDLFL